MTFSPQARASFGGVYASSRLLLCVVPMGKLGEVSFAYHAAAALCIDVALALDAGIQLKQGYHEP